MFNIVIRTFNDVSVSNEIVSHYNLVVTWNNTKRFLLYRFFYIAKLWRKEKKTEKQWSATIIKHIRV